MKLFNIICILFIATSAFEIPLVGQDQESYLALTRKYYYHHLMRNLAIQSRRTLKQKLTNEKTAKLRAALAKAMKAQQQQQEAGEQAIKNSDGLKRIKSRGRMNRFRNFHN